MGVGRPPSLSAIGSSLQNHDSRLGLRREANGENRDSGGAIPNVPSGTVASQLEARRLRWKYICLSLVEACDHEAVHAQMSFQVQDISELSFDSLIFVYTCRRVCTPSSFRMSSRVSWNASLLRSDSMLGRRADGGWYSDQDPGEVAVCFSLLQKIIFTNALGWRLNLTVNSEGTFRLQGPRIRIVGLLKETSDEVTHT